MKMPPGRSGRRAGRLKRDIEAQSAQLLDEVVGRSVAWRARLLEATIVVRLTAGEELIGKEEDGMTDGDRSTLAAPAGHHSPEAGPERCLLGPSGSLGRDHQQGTQP